MLLLILTIWEKHGAAVIGAIIAIVVPTLTTFLGMFLQKSKTKKELRSMDVDLDQKSHDFNKSVLSTNVELVNVVSDLQKLVISLGDEIITVNAKLATAEFEIQDLIRQREALEKRLDSNKIDITSTQKKK